MILACDEEQEKIFPDVPVIVFKNNKNLKSHFDGSACSRC